MIVLVSDPSGLVSWKKGKMKQLRQEAAYHENTIDRNKLVIACFDFYLVLEEIRLSFGICERRNHFGKAMNESKWLQKHTFFNSHQLSTKFVPRVNRLVDTISYR